MKDFNSNDPEVLAILFRLYHLGKVDGGIKSSCGVDRPNSNLKVNIKSFSLRIEEVLEGDFLVMTKDERDLFLL